MTWTIESEPPISELTARLGLLSTKIQKKGLRLGLTASAKPMVKRMRRRAPFRGGALKKSIGFKTLSRKSLSLRGKSATDRDFGYELGVIKKVPDPNYRKAPGKRISQEHKARWMEYGVRPHSTAEKARLSRGKDQHKTPRHPGVRPRPFIIPAIEAEENQLAPRFADAIDVFLKEL